MLCCGFSCIEVTIKRNQNIALYNLFTNLLLCIPVETGQQQKAMNYDVPNFRKENLKEEI